jgi:hypothetical protein
MLAPVAANTIDMAVGSRGPNQRLEQQCTRNIAETRSTQTRSNADAELKLPQCLREGSERETAAEKKQP